MPLLLRLMTLLPALTTALPLVLLIVDVAFRVTVPLPSALALLMFSTPEVRVTPPEAVLTPPRVAVPAVMVTSPVPAVVPVLLSVPLVRVRPPKFELLPLMLRTPLAAFIVVSPA